MREVRLNSVPDYRRDGAGDGDAEVSKVREFAFVAANVFFAHD